MKTIKLFLFITLGCLGSVVDSNAEISSTTQKVLLSIPKMNCSTCPILIKKVLGSVDGVHNVTVNLEQKTATIDFDGTKTSIDTITTTTENVGYPSSLLQELKEK